MGVASIRQLNLNHFATKIAEETASIGAGYMAANIYDNGSFESSSNHFFSLSLQEFHLSQLKKDFHLVHRAVTASCIQGDRAEANFTLCGIQKIDDLTDVD